ncbi:MAG TPA: flagellar protein FlaG [Chloroflexi bacterium]|jgi:uncharacterized FlaG/YvyC family protein|nr:flagellar protein FlaG [Chloroflexota bacterium]
MEGPTRITGVGPYPSEIDAMVREALRRESTRREIRNVKPVNRAVAPAPVENRIRSEVLQDDDVVDVEVPSEDIELESITLRFLVDPETRDVTMQVVERNSGKVLRTVPPEELVDMIRNIMAESRRL